MHIQYNPPPKKKDTFSDQFSNLTPPSEFKDTRKDEHRT